MPSATSQVVHESEVQRQHIRVEIPAEVVINGATYKVKDMSAGGFRLTGFETELNAGDHVDCILMFPFEGFSLKTEIPCYVENFNAKDKTLGCAFAELTDTQISLINTVIKSKMNGTVINEDDILHVASRDNFVSFKKKVDGEDETNNLQKYLTLAALISIGVLGLYIIFGNIYSNVSVLKSYEGIVQSDTIIARATTDGEFRSLIPADSLEVKKGQEIAEITGFTTVTVNNAVTDEQTDGVSIANSILKPNDDGTLIKPITITITSPCDCYIVHKFVQDGEFRALGESLFKLIPLESEPWITASISPTEGQRLNLQDDARIKIAGEAAFIDGNIIDFTITDEAVSTIKVRVKPATELPINLVGRPTYVEFLVF